MIALNILADVNVDRAIVQGLRTQGHVVDWLAEDRSLRKIDDLGVIGRAFRQQSLILTNDTEFIGYVFNDHALTHGVILLRLGVSRAPRAQQVARALEAIQQSQDQLVLPSRQYIPITLNSKPSPRARHLCSLLLRRRRQG